MWGYARTAVAVALMARLIVSPLDGLTDLRSEKLWNGTDVRGFISQDYLRPFFRWVGLADSPELRNFVSTFLRNGMLISHEMPHQAFATIQF
jgi:hypothetical protein